MEFGIDARLQKTGRGGAVACHSSAEASKHKSRFIKVANGPGSSGEMHMGAGCLVERLNLLQERETKTAGLEHTPIFTAVVDPHRRIII